MQRKVSNGYFILQAPDAGIASQRKSLALISLTTVVAFISVSFATLNAVSAHEAALIHLATPQIANLI